MLRDREGVGEVGTCSAVEVEDVDVEGLVGGRSLQSEVRIRRSQAAGEWLMQGSVKFFAPAL